MAEQWCQESLQENSEKSFWGCHSYSVFSYSNQLDWLNASLYFMNFTLQLEIGWMLPLAQSQYFFIFLTFAFSHLRVAFCPCLLPRSTLAAITHPLLLTYSFLTWNFISLISHFPPLGWMFKCSFSHPHSHLLSCLLLLKAGEHSSDVSYELRRPSPAWAPQPEAVLCSLWCIWPQGCTFLRDILKEAGHTMAILTFYGHWRQTQEFQAVFV